MCRDFVSPPPNTNAGGAQRIEGTKVLFFPDQPPVLKRIGEQHHRTGPGGRHGRVEEPRSRAFCRPTWHVRWSFLVVAEVHEGLAFQPKVAFTSRRWLLIGHGLANNFSLMTAPMRPGSVM